MKLIRADQDQFQFELSQSERLRLVHILKLYPLVPEAHHRLSKGRKIPNREENQQLLEDALKHQRQENRKALESMLNEPKRFVKCPAGYRVGFSRGEIEWLLQVLNDVRVGSWIALGSPDQQEEAIKELNEQNTPHFIAMELASYFECYFLNTVSGELKPFEEPALPLVLGKTIEFPDPELADADGMVAAGGDLSVERLLAAYRQGIFPWTVEPITWWSPDPRGIIELDDFHVSESLSKVIRKKPFEVTFDKAFQQVMQGCATPGPKRRGTWITPEFIEAYTELYKKGHAHSVECWQDGKLVGGIYGVAIGGLFAGESMFHLVDNASKVALYHLIQHLQERRFMLFDIQMVTAATEPLGAKAISRSAYLKRLAIAVGRECSF